MVLSVTTLTFLEIRREYRQTPSLKRRLFMLSASSSSSSSKALQVRRRASREWNGEGKLNSAGLGGFHNPWAAIRDQAPERSGGGNGKAKSIWGNFGAGKIIYVVMGYIF
jgi:hypothetical protein